MTKDNSELDIDIGRHQIRIQRRYDAAGAFNDFLIALWFLVGSIFFLDSELMETGTWLFIIGSGQFLLRPMIKLTSLVHLGRFQG